MQESVAEGKELSLTLCTIIVGNSFAETIERKKCNRVAVGSRNMAAQTPRRNVFSTLWTHHFLSFPNGFWGIKWHQRVVDN